MLMTRGDDSGDNSKDHKEWGEDVKTQQEGGQMAWLPLLSGGGGGPIFKFICQSYLHPALVKEKVGIT